MKKICVSVFLLFIIIYANFGQAKEAWIQSSQNENIYVKIDGMENAAHHKLAIIQHGLASNMNHPVVQTAKKAFLDNKFVVITFDSRYSSGKGNNDVEKVRLATFVEDLETVVNWAKTHSFYSEPFALAGHSLGGASVIQFSAKHPHQVNVLVPVTPVVSGQLWEKSCMKNMSDFCRQWKEDGDYKYTDARQQKTVSIPYAVVTDCASYDAAVLLPQIEAETLVITAEKDIVIDTADVQSLSDKIKTGRVALIKSSGHNFNNRQNQTDLYKVIDSFLK